jgi:hypothetical protein
MFEMRELALVVILISLASSATAADRATVRDLGQIIAASRGKSDKEVARQISRLDLTERLSTVQLDRLRSQLPGDTSRLALLAIADASVFLDLPAIDLPSFPAPDSASQDQIRSLAANFIVTSLAKMPDFFARRMTTRFHNLKISNVFDQPIISPSKEFLLLDRLNATVVYRNGKEVVEVPPENITPNSQIGAIGLNNWGVFGPLLSVMMTDVLAGRMDWSHWEQDTGSPTAVFSYAVAKERSSYTVRYCCFLEDGRTMPESKVTSAYHGEIAIDPVSGAILRLVLKADLDTNLPIYRADIMVEYGPVSIGGRSYISPVKSVSISTAMEVISKGIVGHDGHIFYNDIAGKPKVTAINDVVFDTYHVFSTDMRVLPAGSE